MDFSVAPDNLIFHLARDFWHDTAVLLLLQDHPLLLEELAGPGFEVGSADHRS